MKKRTIQKNRLSGVLVTPPPSTWRTKLHLTNISYLSLLTHTDSIVFYCKGQGPWRFKKIMTIWKWCIYHLNRILWLNPENTEKMNESTISIQGIKNYVYKLPPFPSKTHYDYNHSNEGSCTPYLYLGGLHNLMMLPILHLISQ